VEEFEVAQTTARRVVAVLREEGLVYTVPNGGSYVTRLSNCHGMNHHQSASV
jgi:DNA-binding GntR family transcriptional regulator